jgi:hypothetical protein
MPSVSHKSARNEACRALLLMKLKSERAMNYKHFTPNGVAMHSNGAAKHCASIKYNVNPFWEARMRAQSLMLNNEDEISAATEEIIESLKSQYMIGYAPINAKYDGSFRNIRVIVTPKDKRKVKVFAPSGYYAVDPEKIREENFNDRK